MGCVYRRVRWTCVTCKKRRDRSLERKACQADGHQVEQRESPVWWIQYRRAGKSYCESSESELKTKALTLLRDREGDIGKGKPITPKMGKVTFEDGAADILADYKTNGKKSHDAVERRIRKHLSPFFSGWRMCNISTPDVRQFIAKRQTSGASNGEINRELALLKRMFTLTIQGGRLLYKPHIPMLREAPARSGFFEPEQFAPLLAHLPIEIRPLIQFSYITGWRIVSEVLPLEWRQVDFNAGEVRLDAGTTKNREGRVFPFTDELRRILRAQQQEHEERIRSAGLIVPWVFTRNGKQIRNFRKAWETAREAAGIPGRLPHDLRRTAIRNMVRSGVPERVAMTLSGHKTRSVFDRYNIVSGSDLKDAARKMDATAR